RSDAGAQPGRVHGGDPGWGDEPGRRAARGGRARAVDAADGTWSDAGGGSKGGGGGGGGGEGGIERGGGRRGGVGGGRGRRGERRSRGGVEEGGSGVEAAEDVACIS